LISLILRCGIGATFRSHAQPLFVIQHLSPFLPAAVHKTPSDHAAVLFEYGFPAEVERMLFVIAGVSSPFALLHVICRSAVVRLF
jgi:hypothetical protein